MDDAWTQSLPDWTGSHLQALQFFGGAPEIVVPDNLRSAVTTPHLYEPELNRTYLDLADHYGMAVIPARVRKPPDKAKAEAGVQIVERWVLAALRNRRFFSLSELNAAIAELLERLNTRPFRKQPGSRQQAIGSDLLYEEPSAGLLSAFIDRHTRPGGNVIIIDPGRGLGARFTRRMVALGYHHDSTLAVDPAISTTYRGRVLRFSR